MLETTTISRAPIDDDRRILLLAPAINDLSSLCNALRRDGWVVETAARSDDAMSGARLHDYHAIVLDASIEPSATFGLCSLIRNEGHRIPILLLVALGSLEQRVQALEAGADDYLPRTSSSTEISARLGALVSWAARADSRILRAGGIRLDSYAHIVTVDEKPIDLSPREFALLELFMRNPGKALSRKTMLESVWDFAYRSNVVDVYVRYLRDKIGHAVVQTVRGIGYRFTPEKLAQRRLIDLSETRHHSGRSA